MPMWPYAHVPNMPIRPYVHMGLWAYGHMGLWAYGHTLYVGGPIEILVYRRPNGEACIQESQKWAYGPMGI